MKQVFTMLSMVSGVFLGRGIVTDSTELIVSGVVGCVTAILASGYISWMEFKENE